MKPDFYTKAVLTVIAGCLVYFVVQDITPIKEAHAQSGGVVDVNIVKIDGTPLRYPSSVQGNRMNLKPSRADVRDSDRKLRR
jgi:hypothetical protein